MNIITGYRGQGHVKSQEDRNVNVGIFGSGTYIVNVGSKMAVTIVSANEVTIADGLLVAEGCTAEIARGTSESIAVDNGSQGMLRKDLIVARYTRESGTGIEDMQLVYIAGTPAASSPALPSYNTGSIANGDTIVDFPIYTINLDGISIESVTRMVDYAELASKSEVDALATTMGTGTLATVAKNVIGAINELRNKIKSLETKTAGVVRTSTRSISAGATDHLQLASVATYFLIIDTAYPSDTMKGLYLIGVSGQNQISVKDVSNAGDVVLSDAGSGLLRIKNNGSAIIRVTLITTYA